MAIIIIPDVHGRDFWKNAVNGHEEDTIVFLGDYLDPYMYEFEEQKTSDVLRNTINNFKEIIEFKKQHPNNVILLLGNHDCSYAIGRNVCDCRRDVTNYSEIVNLFNENRNLFQIAYKTSINGTDFIFSHAGIQKQYLEYLNISDNVVENLNILWFTENYDFLRSLGICSYYRGGVYPFGSCVWADLHEYSGIYDNGYQIFGHTQLYEPYITDKWACLDSRRGFILNDEGEITRLDGVSIPKKVLASSEEDINS